MIATSSFQCVLIIFQIPHVELPEGKVNEVNPSKAFTIRNLIITITLVPVLLESEQLSFKTYPPTSELILKIASIHD